MFWHYCAICREFLHQILIFVRWLILHILFNHIAALVLNNFRVSKLAVKTP